MHPDAEAELLEAAWFYEKRVSGLGGRFLHEFDAAIQTIQAAPDRWRIVGGEIRRYVMRKFPYGVYSRVQGDTLRILVIKHHKRHPDYGKDRLGL
ncbi:MAG TPA: type II toxin-antitoxin system RelE/ParE family toxin [Isosphaeraceae bacterium]|nr:type II toxin-antitoxin system RelE/ParE family toxin [Isosphaeraceae bacterium]